MDKAMCLSTEQLRAIAEGTVSAADFAAFERHLNECRECQARLASDPADPMATRASPDDARFASPVPPTLAAAVANVVTTSDASSDASSWIEIDALPGASSTPLRAPRKLGPVRLIREIGRGGMGAVWLGRHEMLQRDVAVKFLLAPGFSQRESLAEFLAGAQAAAAVRHLGLTSILHADHIEGLAYLVMEYIDGPTLAQIVRSAGALPQPAALAVLCSVVDAVAALHDAGIVHRDIKPSNVLIDVRGQTFVTDFGLACARGEQTRIAGTPAYMAPEMYQGQITLRSDVFALGVMAYELLTGQLPFTGTPQELKEHYCNPDRPMDKLRDSGIDASLIECIERAMHHNPLFRHKTARHLLAALESTPAPAMKAASYLAPLVSKVGGALPAGDQRDSKSSIGSSYYDMLSVRAARKLSGMLGRPQSAPAVAYSSKIVHDGVENVPHISCFSCGYDLHGQSITGSCPECGSSIELSLMPSRLSFADAHWLGHIAHATQFATRCLLWGLLFPLLWLALTTTPLGSVADWRVAERVADIAIALYSMMLAAAAVRLCLLEPGCLDHVRFLARAGAQLAIFLCVPQLLRSVLPARGILLPWFGNQITLWQSVSDSGLERYTEIYTFVGPVGAALACVMAIAAMLVSSARLVSRLPDPKLRWWLHRAALFYLFVLSTALVAFLSRGSLWDVVRYLMPAVFLSVPIISANWLTQFHERLATLRSLNAAVAEPTTAPRLATANTRSAIRSAGICGAGALLICSAADFIARNFMSTLGPVQLAVEVFRGLCQVAFLGSVFCMTWRPGHDIAWSANRVFRRISQILAAATLALALIMHLRAWLNLQVSSEAASLLLLALYVAAIAATLVWISTLPHVHRSTRFSLRIAAVATLLSAVPTFMLVHEWFRDIAIPVTSAATSSLLSLTSATINWRWSLFELLVTFPFVTAIATLILMLRTCAAYRPMILEQQDRLPSASPLGSQLLESPHRANVETLNGRLCNSIPCIRCGYDLFSQLRDGQCPECGTPIHETSLPQRLLFADTAWLKRVSRGLKLWNLTLALIVLWPLLIAIIRMTVDFGATPTRIVVTLGIFFTAFTAERLMRTDEPSQALPKPAAFRWMRIALLTAGGVMFLAEIVPIPWTIQSGFSGKTTSVAVATAVTFMLVLLVAFMHLVAIEPIARRSDDAKLAKQIRRRKPVAIAGLVLYATFILCWPFDNQLSGFIGIVASLAMLALFITFLGSAYVSNRLASTLDQAIKAHLNHADLMGHLQDTDMELRYSARPPGP